MTPGAIDAVSSVPTPTPPPSRSPEIVAYLAQANGHVLSALGFSPDGTLLATGDWEGGVALWDVPAGRESTSLAGHEAPLSGRPLVHAVTFSPDGKTLATGGDEKKIRLWDVRTGQRVGEHLTVDSVGSNGVQSIGAIAFSSDGSKLAAGGRAVGIFDTSTYELLGGGETFSACRDIDIDIVFRAGGAELVTLCHNTVTVWDVATGSEIAETELVRDDMVAHLALSPDGTIAALELGFKVGLFDVDTGEELAALPTDGRTMPSVASFNADGNVLIYGGSAQGGAGKLMWLWNIDSQKPIGSTLNNGGNVADGIASIALSPDASHAAVGYLGTETRARLWSLED